MKNQKLMFFCLCYSGVSERDLWQEHLVKQGMKAEQAASLVEMTVSKCSTVKYDVELAEEYIARQVIKTPVYIICLKLNSTF